jgi:hypothetical protein
MGQPQKLNNGDECEAKQIGGKIKLAGDGSDMYKFLVTITRVNGKSTKWYVHYKPNVKVGQWRIGDKDDNVADFPAGLEDVKTACKDAKKG